MNKEKELVSVIHYVLLKFAPGTDLDAAEARVRKTYDELAEALPYLNDPEVYWRRSAWMMRVACSPT